MLLLVLLGFIVVGVIYRQAIFGTMAEDAAPAPTEPTGSEPGSVQGQATVDAAETDRSELESSAAPSLPLE